MGFSFWDTVLGHNLAEILSYNLPRIANRLEQVNNKKQSVHRVTSESLEASLNEFVMSGKKIVTVVNVPGATGMEFVVIVEE